MNHIAHQPEALVNSLANHYADYGVTPEDFSVVSVPTLSRLAIVHSAASGIDLGNGNRSWNSIFREFDNPTFVMVYNGERIDTRLGMTRLIYKVLIDNAKTTGCAVDSVPSRAERVDDPAGKPWVYQWNHTLLTGEGVTASDHEVAILGLDGTIKYSFGSRQNDSPTLRFRPTILLEF